MRAIKASAIAIVLACAMGAALAQNPVVRIRVLVKQKDLGASVPFPGVPGFAILRNNLAFQLASCPDESDARGELTCTLACAPDTRNATLLLMPPTREKAVKVAGMKVPPAKGLQVTDCRITTQQPIELVYKSEAAQLAELQATSPAVYNAAFIAANGEVRTKPFLTASRELEQLAVKEENRNAIRELGELGRFVGERQAAGPAVAAKAPRLEAKAADYAVGTSSVLLKAQTADAMGPEQANKLVKLSAEAAELDKSITNVTKTLDVKPVLVPNEVKLNRAVKAMARSQSLY